MSQSNQISDDEALIPYRKTNTLYSRDFGNSRYFSVIHEDEDGFEIGLAPKTMLRVRFLYDENDIEGIDIVKVVSEKETQRVSFNKFNLQQLRAFLTFISTTNLNSIPEAQMSLFNGDELNEETERRITELLSRPGGEQLIRTLIENGIVTSSDIVNTAYRKRQLEVFETLLNDGDFWKSYAQSEGISDHSEEKVWQHFMAKNEWVFGYGLDYRYESILQKEFHSSGSQAGGAESVISDFLLGDSKFTTFVEIKKPSTPIFGKSKNRSNSWTLSNDLVDSVSQILEQKASGQLRLDAGNLFDKDGKRLDQKAHDSKVILILGHWGKVASESDLERQIKVKTFELYRRDSRNIIMMTFDELYERARFIVLHPPNADF